MFGLIIGAALAQGQPSPDLARLRLGDPRWAGRSAEHLAVSADGTRLLLGGEDGAYMFDAATGAQLGTVTGRTVTGVAFRPGGEPAWMTEQATYVTTGGDTWGPPGWNGDLAEGAVAFTPRDELVTLRSGELFVSAADGEGRGVKVNANRLVLSPDGARAMTFGGYGLGTLTVVDLASLEILSQTEGTFQDAAFVGERMLVATEEAVTLDGQPVLLPDGAGIHAVAASLDGEAFAVVTEEQVHVFRDGQAACAAAVPSSTGEVAWGAGRLFVGHRSRTAPIRVDPATCAVDVPAGGSPVRQVVVEGDRVVTRTDAALEVWDAGSGARLALRDGQHYGPIAAMGDALVTVSARGWATTMTLADLSTGERRKVEAADWPGERFVRLIGLNEVAPYQPPDEPVAAAAPTGHVAAGLEQLVVVDPDGTRVAYDLTDQVHIDLAPPIPGLKPETLAMTALAWNTTGSRLASAWELSVTDVHGDRQVRHWVGVLQPRSRGLAGFPVKREVHALQVSADGKRLAMLDDVARVVRLGGNAGERGVGAAQRLDPDQLWFAVVDGIDQAIALSDDGTWVAVGTDEKIAVYRVTSREPVFEGALGNRGTTALAFAGETLWVGGADGTVLALALDALESP